MSKYCDYCMPDEGGHMPRCPNRGKPIPLQMPWSLTKRELFAAMALNGLIQSQYRIGEDGFNKELPSRALGMADALLAELEKSDDKR